MVKKIAFFIAQSRVAAVIASLLCLGLWIYSLAGTGCQSAASGPKVWGYAIVIFYLLAGVAVVRLTKKHAISTKHQLLPLTLLMMGGALSPLLPAMSEGAVQLALIMAAYHILLDTYRERYAMSSYFMAFILLGAGCIITPQLLFVLPLLILSTIPLQSLHFRTFCASLLGIILPFWVAFSVLFLTDSTHHISQYFASAIPSSYPFPTEGLSVPIGNVSVIVPVAAIHLVWILLTLIPASIHVISNVNMKVSVRASLYHTCLLMLILLIAIVVFPALYHVLLPTLLFLTPILGANFFDAHLSTLWRSVYLVVMTLVWLLAIGLYLWSIL